jgi:hypothetical protein
LDLLEAKEFYISNREDSGRFFREAWIVGVNKHFPGTPKPGYVAPWESMPDWEKEIVTEICAQIQALIQAGVQGGQIKHLNREQGGRVICIAWIGQVYKHISDPKPSYVCNWEEMPLWEQKVYMGIF